MRVLCNGKKLTLRQIGAPVLLVAILTSLCNGQKSQTSQKAADGQQEVPLMLSLEEVYKGKTVMANLASEERCTTCQGRGHVPGPTGAQWPCDKCRGKGTMSTTTQARIIIPRGAPEGGTAMVPTDAGNVRVKFSSKLHKVFRRSGRFDLAHVATLSEAEAEGGFTRRIQLLSGSTLLLTRVGPSAAVDFLPLPGLGMPKGPKDVDGFGELGITFALAPSVLDTGVRTNFAMRSATLPRLTPGSGGVGRTAPQRLHLLGSLEPSTTNAVPGLVAAMRIRDEDTASKGWRVIDGTRCFSKNATIYTWEALLAPRSGVSGGVVSADPKRANVEAESYMLSGAMDGNPEFNSYGFGSLNGMYVRNGWLCNNMPMYQKQATESGGSGWALFTASDSKTWAVAPGCNHPSQSTTGVSVADLNAALLGKDCGNRADSATCVWLEGNTQASDWDLRPQLKLQATAPRLQPLLLDGETLSIVDERTDEGTAGTGGDGTLSNDPSSGGGLGARLLLLRPVESVGGVDKAWEIVGQSPAVTYSGEEARQVVVLDSPLIVEPGVCLGVGYEDGGVATLYFVPGEKHRKDSRVCPGVSALSGVAPEQLYKRLEQRHCTEVSRQYLMQVGYLDGWQPQTLSATRSSPVPSNPEQEHQEVDNLENAKVHKQQTQRATQSPSQSQVKTSSTGETISNGQNDERCLETGHKIWLADGTNFPREVLDQDTISLEKVKVGPTTFTLKTCFQLPQSMWKGGSSKVLAVQFSFGATGVLQTAWSDYCTQCVQERPGNRAEVSSSPLQLSMLDLAPTGAGQVWTTKLRVTLLGCARPLVYTSNGVQIVP